MEANKKTKTTVLKSGLSIAVVATAVLFLLLLAMPEATGDTGPIGSGATEHTTPDNANPASDNSTRNAGQLDKTSKPLPAQAEPTTSVAVRLNPGFDLSAINTDAYNARGITTVSNDTVSVKFDTAADAEAFSNSLQNNQAVDFSFPDISYELTAIPGDDTDRALLWGLDNTGQTINSSSGTVDADIDWPEAQTLAALGADSEIIVAVIDSGVAMNHPDLTNRLWDGSSCVDENGSALGGCVGGYDFYDFDKTPFPDDGDSHGTHVAGTVAAEYSNGEGILGVAPNVKIMAIRTNLSITNVGMAIDFARENGAHIINASFAHNSTNSVIHNYETAIIQDFVDDGGLLVAAASNEGTNNDSTPYYPASYDIDNIIAVAATTFDDGLASYSNYGATSVDVGAPGSTVYSTVIHETLVDSEDFETLEGGGSLFPMFPEANESAGSMWGQATAGTEVMLVDETFISDGYYNNNSDYTVESLTYDISSADQAGINMIVVCDTEMSPFATGDYLALQVSANGSTFSDLEHFNEYEIDILTLGAPGGGSGSSGIAYSTVLDPSYLTSTFSARFRWVTDSSDNSYFGCYVDDFELVEFDPDSSLASYNYSNGTSMAAPHVAGLAGLVWGFDPTLTSTEVRDAIYNGGDSIPALSGTTTTGKRINAFGALASVAEKDFVLSETSISLDENAGTDSFTVALSQQVGSGTVVEVDVSTSDNSEALVSDTDDEISPTSQISLTFDDTDWSTPQTVTITGINDSDYDEDSATITVSLNTGGTTDAAYMFSQPADETVIVQLTDDTDGDGVTDDMEYGEAPSGDGNEDGTDDALQSNVATVQNPATGAHTTVELVSGTSCTTITDLSISETADLLASEDGYDYPVGAINLSLDCTVDDDYAQLEVFYDQDYDTTGWSHRSYDAANNEFDDTSGSVTMTTDTVDAATVTKLVFDVYDNLSYDYYSATNQQIGHVSGPATGSASGALESTNDNDNALWWTDTSNLTAGYIAEQFVAKGVFTRGDVALLLHRIAGSPTPTMTGSQLFDDVSNTDSFDAAVGWMHEQGIDIGSGTTYSPGDATTRGAFALSMHRAAGSPVPSVDGDTLFDDVSSADPYDFATGWMHEQGIDTGTSATLYSPGKVIAVPQAALSFFRYLVN